ncbi:FtsK/SpoIIIE domain-containing protein [Streptomyces caniferus]|uniref:FtsK/SpoIIIE domain-containing protein n=1 Tax=Streptomyces caniferus TaxID=285557 RepID=UPI0037F24C3D
MGPLHDAATIALALAGAVLAAFSLFSFSRYVGSDKDTRANLRMAFHMRRSWRRVGPMIKVAATDRTPTTFAQLTTPAGQRPEPRVVLPSLRTKADRTGVTIFMNTVPDIGLEQVTAAATALADEWRCARVSVAYERPGLLRLRAVRSDPLVKPTRYRPDGTPPASLVTWPLGVDEYGEAVPVALSNVPGVTVAGLPGYGKTSLVNALITRFAPSDAVQFAVVDGKAPTALRGDYADTAERLFAFVGDDPAEANELFRRLVRLLDDRMQHMRRARGSNNFWDKGPTAAWPLVVLIIDEAHTFFRDHKGSDSQTKKLATLAAQNARLVETLVKQGRSAGILTILATQKATGDAIPTFIRDVCPVGLSFAQKTAEAAVAALGDDIRKYPDADPVTLQDPAYVGVASMRTPGRAGFTRVRTPQVTSADAARITAQSAHLTVDPAELLPRGDSPDPIDFTKAA